MKIAVLVLLLLAAATDWAQAASAGAAAQTPAATSKQPSAPPPMTVPRGKGLPVVVRTGVYFVDIHGMEESKAQYTATFDVRLRWGDPRLAYDAAQTPRGYYEWRGAEAEAKLATIWAPDVGIVNIVDKPTFVSKSLRLTPDGEVELMQRMTAKLTTTFEIEDFPFDRQNLPVVLVSRRETADLLTFDYREDELEFSRLAAGVKIDGWTPGLVDLKREPAAGWYGESYAQVKALLDITRKPGGAAASIFIPLVASLLIPMLAIWLNRIDDGVFQIETFELSNIIIGGLFAVIALNFTVNAAYEALGTTDNTVSRLFALNYATLGVSLLINILVFRFEWVARCCGKYVQEELYRFFVWAVPAVVFTTTIAVLAVAMA